MSIQSPIHTEFNYGEHKVIVTSGDVANLAKSTVVLHMGECIIMANIAHKACESDDRDFFPLSVHYSERAYSIGRIPGGFPRREGRPSEREVIICRLIDRSMRPMFADGFMDEVQVNVTLLQHDPSVDPDIAGLMATSFALALTDLPFTPVAAARIGLKNNEFILNPSFEEAKDSELDLVVSGSAESYVMVESSAKEVSESKVLEALAFAKENISHVVTQIKELEKKHKPEVTWKAAEDAELNNAVSKISEQFTDQIASCYKTTNKKQRVEKLSQLQSSVVEKILADTAASSEDVEKATTVIVKALKKVEKQYVRSMIINKEPRIDGRDYTTVRPIDIKVGYLPKTHGSALFTRGETQALVVTTLADEASAQILDDITREEKDRFMLHYNFPAYSVGECGMPLSPKRREIGHGRLAKKAIMSVLPQNDESFPYVLRIVSEILASNGSSSMATVCGSSLALMDAGIKISNAVAGIAMGLVIDQDSNYTVLSDILGDEDHYGDMDFKVAGTKNGITALQMDIKVSGIDNTILENALEQAKQGRMHILEKMNQAIDAPRQEVADTAPRVIQFNINASKIRDVIGRGGSTIREIIDQYAVAVDISDAGLVKITATDAEKGNKAKAHIEKLTAEVEVGQVYEGKIVKLMDFGAFVNILPGKDAFLHISQICDERVENISHKLSEGQIIRAEVVEIDRQNRIKISMKNIPQHA